jgi:hypothetical protein
MHSVEMENPLGKIIIHLVKMENPVGKNEKFAQLKWKFRSVNTENQLGKREKRLSRNEKSSQ